MLPVGDAMDLRSIGHAFHTTSKHNVANTKLEVLRSHHNSLHTRSADLVDGGSLGSLRAAC